MTLENKNKLFQLLETHSPSGAEHHYQRVWMDMMRPFAHLDTDQAGNAIASLNPEADFKIMMAAHCDEISMMVTGINPDNGFIGVVKCGGINPAVLPGSKVTILGYSGEKIRGVVGLDPQAKPKPAELSLEKGDLSSFFIDTGIPDHEALKKLVRRGDYVVYDGSPEVIGEDKIVSKALDNKTGSFIVAETLRKLSEKKLPVGVYAVNTTGEETNGRGAYAAAANIRPDLAIICDVTFETRGSEGRYNRPKVLFGKGPAISFGSPVSPVLNAKLEEVAQKHGLPIQLELTPEKTHTDGDTLLRAANGVPIVLVSLPVRYMHSPVEMASLKDIDIEIDLLVEFIKSFTGKEDLRPVTP